VIRGVIFDLDGTLADSQLDFDAMRREMELPAGLPILEALKALEPSHAARCHDILQRHELAGVQRATLLPGVAEFCSMLAIRGIRQAVSTRNSRQITDATLHKLGLKIELSLTRDDGLVKPDPWPVLHICRHWGLSPADVIVIGDYRFDIESGRAAGCRTVLLTHSREASTYPNKERADLVLTSLAEYPRLVNWIDSLKSA
jgi:HAD superfamily hydrolase (TIGR01549 family)